MRLNIEALGKVLKYLILFDMPFGSSAISSRKDFKQILSIVFCFGFKA